MIEGKTIYVGKRAIDDKVKIPIKGGLITPKDKSRTLLLVNTGILMFNPELKENYQDYIKYFGNELGHHYNTYITELRYKGRVGTGEQYLDDLVQIYNHITDRTEPDKVIFIGHSMGAGIGLHGDVKRGLKVDGHYNMCAYPSYGTGSKLLKFTDYIETGPFALKVKDVKTEKPVRFAMASDDELLFPIFVNKKKRKKAFKDEFLKYENSSVVEIKGNHCYNKGFLNLAPFNKENPDVLLNDVRRFIEKIK